MMIKRVLSRTFTSELQRLRKLDYYHTLFVLSIYKACEREPKFLCCLNQGENCLEI